MIWTDSEAPVPSDEQSLRDFLDNLRGLSVEWQRRVADLAVTAADRTTSELQSVYPEKTGNLRRGVRTVTTRGTSIQSVKVRSAAPHAHLYEYGTAARVDRTKRTPAFRGVMPRANVFIPTAIRHRRTFLGECQALADERREL